MIHYGKNAAQHSVHPIPDKERRGHGGGSLRVFRQFAWLGVGSDKMALSHPAHQRVTQAVGNQNYLHDVNKNTLDYVLSSKNVRL
jgi:hypothetical protein